MIMETAYIDVVPGREEEFIAALEQGKAIVAQAKGFQVMHVHRGVERPSTFLLALGWDTVEDHTVGFRQGPLFAQWRDVISPYFANPPQVEHWELFD
jgi:heme-degrading monooxygenase HmoA